MEEKEEEAEAEAASITRLLGNSKQRTSGPADLCCMAVISWE